VIRLASRRRSFSATGLAQNPQMDWRNKVRLSLTSRVKPRDCGARYSADQRLMRDSRPTGVLWLRSSLMLRKAKLDALKV
jgi:hypothetical protein